MNFEKLISNTDLELSIVEEIKLDKVKKRSCGFL
jgi:hypothetical protein